MLDQALSPAISTGSIWQDCLARIQEKVGPSSYETWFRATELQSAQDGLVRVLVPNRFFADFIEVHFRDLIQTVLISQGVPCTAVELVPHERDWNVIAQIQETLVQSEGRRTVPAAKDQGCRFHPNYRFDTFVIGDGNRMAHAASLAVAEAPGRTSFNPLIIYGGTGLGKTHLLQAIGHFAQSEGTSDCVTYLTAQEFINQYISYVIEKKDSLSFHNQFRNTDLLLLDDIHFFSGKPGNQKEFFRIFNRLLMENKQIVLSTDRPPDQIPDMMAHIINRFMAGLIADVQPPNLETRMAILRKKAETDGQYLSPEVVEHIASHITSNVRELEGTLIKLIASSSFTGRDITIEVAREICGDALQQKGRRLTVRFIQSKVAEYFGTSPNQLTVHSRKKDCSVPRNIAMYLAKKWTRQSLRTIGLEFGNRDYSTVVYAAKRVESELAANEELRKQIEALEETIRPLV